MRSSRRAARAAIFFGALAVLAIPAGILASRETDGVTLVRSLYAAVPAACLLGLIAVGASRRAGARAGMSIRPERRGPLRTARACAWLGLYVGVTGALALGVYGVLRFAQ